LLAYSEPLRILRTWWHIARQTLVAQVSRARAPRASASRRLR